MSNGKSGDIPVPEHPGYKMTYELYMVFSRRQAIITAETRFIHPTEIVGSVKTTSKDRIDKVFLDKHILTRLLGRDVPVGVYCVDPRPEMIANERLREQNGDFQRFLVSDLWRLADRSLSSGA